MDLAPLYNRIPSWHIFMPPCPSRQYLYSIRGPSTALRMYLLYVYLAPICAGGVGFLGSRIIGPRDGTPCEFFCLSIDDLTSLSPSLNQNVLGCPGNHIFPPLSSSSSSSPSRSSHTTYLSSFRFILHPPPPPPAHPPTGPDLLLDSLG